MSRPVSDTLDAFRFFPFADAWLASGVTGTSDPPGVSFDAVEEIGGATACTGPLPRFVNSEVFFAHFKDRPATGTEVAGWGSEMDWRGETGSSETRVSSAGTTASVTSVALVESSTNVDRGVSFSIDGKTFGSVGRVRGEAGVSGRLVEGEAGGACATGAGLDIDGLRIGRGIEMGVADFGEIGAAGGASETTAGADSGIAGCSGSPDDTDGGGTDSVISLS